MPEKYRVLKLKATKRYYTINVLLNQGGGLNNVKSVI